MKKSKNRLEKDMDRRVFILSGRKFNGNCGGSAGVNYKLFLANEKYKLINSMYHLFSDRNIDSSMLRDLEKIGLADSSNLVKRFLKRIGIFFVTKSVVDNRRLNRTLENYNSIYKFSDNDIYIFHDPQIAYNFLHKYCFGKTLFVYHQQGEAYYEWKSMVKSRSFIVRKYYAHMEKFIFSRTRDIGFPSKGAYYSYNLTADNNSKIENCKIFYNGVPALENIDNTRKQYLLSQREISFLTVSVLNDAKGVEKIPQLIKRLKDNLKGYKIKWTLVGDGSHHKEVEEQIIKWNLKENVYWITESLPHEQIIEMMKETHFYIMMHNFSIFDFATIEAMAAGCVPILSNVPANIEVGKNDNIVVVSEPSDIDEINETFINEKYNSYSKKNIEVQNTYFDDLAFLKGYFDYINSID